MGPKYIRGGTLGVCACASTLAVFLETGGFYLLRDGKRLCRFKLVASVFCLLQGLDFRVKGLGLLSWDGDL